jgi:hypothetical protein
MLFVTVNDEVKQRAIEAITALSGVYDIEISEHKKSRSVAQNRLMWMWLNLMAKETGNEPDDLHTLFKIKFLGTETKTVYGTTMEIPQSTTKLTTKEFTGYLDRIEALATDIGIRLPHPATIYEEAYGL